MAGSVTTRELGWDIAAHSLQNLFGQPAAAVTEEGLYLSEVAGRSDSRESVMVDIPCGEGGVPDVGPGRRDGGEVTFAVTKPDVEGVLYEPGRRGEIEMAVSVEIDEQRLKAPLYPRPERAGQ